MAQLPSMNMRGAIIMSFRRWILEPVGGLDGFANVGLNGFANGFVSSAQVPLEDVTPLLETFLVST
jgi:hypothetical protein